MVRRAPLWLLLGLAGRAGAADPPIEGGSGDYRFRYRSDLLVLPAEVDMANGHGLAKDEAGRVYFTYEPKSLTDATRVLVRFAADGTRAQLLGPDNRLAVGVPHGLRISYEDKGAFLYHANNMHAIHKTDLEGNVVWSVNVTEMWTGTPFWPCLPTDAVVPPGAKTVYVADGYGSSYVHLFDAETGKYQGLSFGGAGNATSPQQFNCPHGINFDKATGRLVVSDRANARLQYVTLNGTHLDTVDLSKSGPAGAAGQLPDNVDLQTEQGPMLVPSLDGTLAVLSEGKQVLSVLDIAQLLGDKCPHPHDAIFLANGDVALCCWNPGHLSYWQRLPNAVPDLETLSV